jgi:hypothetical protein
MVAVNRIKNKAHIPMYSFVFIILCCKSEP